MVDKATFQKEIEAKLKEWQNVIYELRAEGEEMLKSHREDLLNHAKKSQMILSKYVEAIQELGKSFKTDDETCKKKHQANIERIMNELDRLWERGRL